MEKTKDFTSESVLRMGFMVYTRRTSRKNL